MTRPAGPRTMRLFGPPPAADDRRKGRWYVIDKNTTRDTTDIYIYDEIGYWGVPASDLVDDINRIQADRFTLHLNTPGGEVWDGLAIYQALKAHPAAVDVIVESLAASAGSFIAQAGATITMRRPSQMMIHNALGVSFGTAAEMRKTADLLEGINGDIAGIYAARAGRDEQHWLDAMNAETWYRADEAVDAGLADRVETGGTGDTPANAWDLSMFRYPNRDAAPAPTSSYDVASIRDTLERAFA